MAEGMTEAAALEQTYKAITKLAPQVPRAFMGEDRRVEFLRKALVERSWANELPSRIATSKLTFQQLYGELEAPLHYHNEARLVAIHAP